MRVPELTEATTRVVVAGPATRRMVVASPATTRVVVASVSSDHSRRRWAGNDFGRRWPGKHRSGCWAGLSNKQIISWSLAQQPRQAPANRDSDPPDQGLRDVVCNRWKRKRGRNRNANVFLRCRNVRDDYTGRRQPSDDQCGRCQPSDDESGRC
jgi:hypothetical protein